MINKDYYNIIEEINNIISCLKDINKLLKKSNKNGIVLNDLFDLIVKYDLNDEFNKTYILEVLELYKSENVKYVFGLKSNILN